MQANVKCSLCLLLNAIWSSIAIKICYLRVLYVVHYSIDFAIEINLIFKVIFIIMDGKREILSRSFCFLFFWLDNLLHVPFISLPIRETTVKYIQKLLLFGYETLKHVFAIYDIDNFCFCFLFHKFYKQILSTCDEIDEITSKHKINISESITRQCLVPIHHKESINFDEFMARLVFLV